MRSAFGKATGGGKRSAPRAGVPIPVIVRTLTTTSSAALVDVSETGARISGSALPRSGEEVDLSFGTLRVFGTIAWAERGECGVAFDDRLRLVDVVRLRQQAGAQAFGKLTVDERIALEQWIHGVSP